VLNDRICAIEAVARDERVTDGGSLAGRVCSDSGPLIGPSPTKRGPVEPAGAKREQVGTHRSTPAQPGLPRGIPSGT